LTGNQPLVNLQIKKGAIAYLSFIFQPDSCPPGNATRWHKIHIVWGMILLINQLICFLLNPNLPAHRNSISNSKKNIQKHTQ